MRTIMLGTLLLSAACFNEQQPTTVSELRQRSPAEKASDELTEVHDLLAQKTAAERADIRAAGPLLAAGDPTTRAAVSIVTELDRALTDDPALHAGGTLAATAPSLAARLANLRAALGSHHQLLRNVGVAPLPEADGLDADADPTAAFVEAAVRIEETMAGRWPLKRVFIAYALELQAIRDEADALTQCTDACPPGTADRAAALRDAAAALAERLEEFAALYC